MTPDQGSRRRSPSWWDHQRHPLARLRREVEALVREALPLGPGDRVVDLGCGDAPYRPLFVARGAEYIGCDIEGREVVLLEPGRPVPLGDGSAAAVVSFQVLEHVWDLDWYLGEAHRILSPRGRLMLSTHGTWLYHPHPTDFRRWTRDGLVRELETRGFDVLHVSGVVGPLAWTTQFRLLGIREVLVKIPLLGRLLLAPIAALMNARMALEDRITPSRIREANASVYVTLSAKSAPR
jgi:SAM-dependent methyltransferase